MTMAGAIITSDATAVDTMDINSGNKKTIFVGKKDGDDMADYSAYKYTITKKNVAVGDTWYCKPFVGYTDADGAAHLILGDATMATATESAALVS